MPNLRDAMICIDCEEIFPSHYIPFRRGESITLHWTRCPTCVSKSIFPLAKWINRKITDSATPEAAGLCSITEQSKSK